MNNSCKRCVQCEGQDHHWMFDADEKHPRGQMVCKHCPARRAVLASDMDEGGVPICPTYDEER